MVMGYKKAKNKNRISDGFSDKAILWISSVVITILAILCVYPYLNVIAKSFSSPLPVISGEVVGIWPVDFTTESYQLMFLSSRFVRSFGNTVFVTIIGTALNLVMTIMVAYGVTRKNLPGRKLIMILYIITMVFTGGLIPTYLIVVGAGLRNTLWALIIPTLVSPFNLVLMRNFMNGIPGAISESATIDGANHFTMLFRIIIPLSLPSIATIALFLAVSYWNSYFQALIYIDDRTVQTLQLYLHDIMMNIQDAERNGILDETTRDLSNDSLRGAAIFCSTIPIICVYPFLQKYYVKGVRLGAVKG
jgi:putative aldouronate transport system permease protein